MKHTATKHWLVIAAIAGIGLTSPAARADSPTLEKIHSTWPTTASSGITDEKSLQGKTVVITQGSLNLATRHENQ